MSSHEYAGENLIFLISQPRAGSTLLQRLLGGHPRIHTTTEPWIMLHPLYALRREGVQSEFDSHQARIALEDFLRNLEGGEEVYFQAIRKMAEHLYRAALEKTGAAYFLDKTPRYYSVIPELSRVFPAARFVILLRNPLAVLHSILETWVKSNLDRLSLHKQDLMNAPEMIADGLDLLGERAAIVRYEELAADSESTLRQLCGKLSCSFIPEMMKYQNHPLPAGRMGDPVRVHLHDQPVPDYIESWKNGLVEGGNGRLAQAYQASLGAPLFSRLGYSPVDFPLQESSDSSWGEGRTRDMLRALGLGARKNICQQAF